MAKVLTDDERAQAQSEVYKRMTSYEGRLDRLRPRARRIQDEYEIDQCLSALVDWTEAGCPGTKAGLERLRFWAPRAKELLGR